MNRMKTLLVAEIENDIDNLAGLTFGSSEYAKGAESVAKLISSANEIAKNEASIAQSEQQMKEERNARIVKNIIDVVDIVLPLGMTGLGIVLALEFEKTDTFTTTIGRKLLDKIISRR